MNVVSGSLPPGLQLGGACEYIISGTPTKAGSYSFTVRITPQPNRLANVSAVFNAVFPGPPCHRPAVAAFSIARF